MADPILNMLEIGQGDSLGYLRQNDRNLIMARLIAKEMESDSLSTPPSTTLRGKGYIVASSGTGNWAGAAANDIAICLSDTPTTSSGWIFITPSRGMTVWILVGTNPGHRVFDGTDWSTAV
jgi:hypothetical protein